jgi:hypothetical protein
VRQAVTAESLVERRAENAPLFEELHSRIAAAVKSIESTGTAMWDGEQVDGPALIIAIHQTWREAQNKTLRCRAIDWARGVKSGLRPPSELDELDAAYAQFAASVGPTVDAIIVADASRALPDIVPTLYARYLDALATVAPSVAAAGWHDSAERGLQALREKSPAFAKQADNYQRATSDLLRWRRRAAQAAARARSANASTLEQLLAKAATGAHPDVTIMKRPAPALVRDVAAATVAQPALATRLMAAGDGTALSSYAQRTTARVSDCVIPASAIAQLKEDLLVTADSPPLTLAAATAIASAEQGTLSAAGGHITGVELQSLIVPLMTLDVDKASAFPLGPLPSDNAPFPASEPIAQVQYVFAVQPSWLQHVYIFTELPPRP